MKLFSGALPGAQEHHSAPLASTPALLTCLRASCWASLKHTALVQLKLPSRSLRHRDKCPSWKALTLYRWGNWDTGFVPFSIAELLLPVLGISCLPREDRLDPRLWTQVLLPQGLDYVAVCVSAKTFPLWLAGSWLPRAQPYFSFRKQRIWRNL